MKANFRLVRLLVLAAVFAAAGLGVPGTSSSSTGTTLDNLMAAYNGESNAHAKYLEYAKKADQEGYLRVARLFRAAARAEEIHLNNHAQVIESMGGKPKADIKLPEIKSTKENLEDALKGESYERDTMYPEFIAQAEKEKNDDAVRTFTYAKEAEAEHAKLYQAALGELDQWKSAKADFYVCPTCGYTVENTPGFTSCPVCNTPAKLYEKMS
ncbi:rubrerythrin family protein [Desulforhabdus sp. TSK]|uniref:rubrerythrin family protein n=1 Tax=Desulforhabdus sp. TSK TaxID=2925014 RepID=UPI001FC8D6ED|nr:ferritin family protein [Desulforhabdus sp. TSK]GKT08557.1 rubrerythrin [Desulforhabdus sp. TSK]